jgi:four helix bundle protein
MDYAIGSGLECAACLDIARTKRLLAPKDIYEEKEGLSQIVRMMVGLRNTWSQPAHVIRENGPGYETMEPARDNGAGEKPLFHHETLDVYKVSLEVATAFSMSDAVAGLSNRAFRRLDELLTSIILNIAEGNGRFSDADQSRFLGTSHESAIKLAARLDLCVAQNQLPQDEVVAWKSDLQRVSIMTFSMIKGGQR